MSAPKGWRFCQVKCAKESRGIALAALAKFHFVIKAEDCSEGVKYEIDLAELLRPGDGPAAELMVRRDVERAVALHRVEK